MAIIGKGKAERKGRKDNLESNGCYRKGKDEKHWESRKEKVKKKSGENKSREKKGPAGQ